VVVDVFDQHDIAEIIEEFPQIGMQAIGNRALRVRVGRALFQDRHRPFEIDFGLQDFHGHHHDFQAFLIIQTLVIGRQDIPLRFEFENIHLIQKVFDPEQIL